MGSRYPLERHAGKTKWGATLKCLADRCAALTVVACCLCALQLRAEEQPDVTIRHLLADQRPETGLANDPNQFGDGEQYTTFGLPVFAPQASTMSWGYLGSGYIQPAASSVYEWIAQIGPSTGIPVGATVIQVCGYVFDDSAVDEVVMTLGSYEFGSSADDPSFTLLETNQTGLAPTPGYTASCVSPTDLVVRSFMDFGGDATMFYGYHRVGITLKGSGTDLGFGGVLVRWRRQLGPAPGSASFNDVPTNFWAFQHIEALVDSGITSGCGGGSFCPNTTVTRAEMAVFLAKALGLNWPF